MQSKQKTINLSRLVLIIKAFVAIEKFPIFADDFIVPRGLNRILQYNEKNM